MEISDALKIIFSSIRETELNYKLKTIGINKISSSPNSIFNIDEDSTLIIDQSLNLENRMEISYLANSIYTKNINEETINIIFQLLELDKANLENTIKSFKDPKFLLKQANINVKEGSEIIDWENNVIKYISQTGESKDISFDELCNKLSSIYKINPNSSMNYTKIINTYFTSSLTNENVINLMSNVVDSTIILKQNIDALSNLKAKINYLPDGEDRDVSESKNNNSLGKSINSIQEVNILYILLIIILFILSVYLAFNLYISLFTSAETPNEQVRFLL
jgi:hypothetical protein